MNPIYLTFFIPVIFGAAIALGAMVYYNRKLDRTSRLVQELARKAGGTVSRKSILTGIITEGLSNGMPFACRYFPGSKNNPPSLTVWARIPFPAKLTIRREAWYDRFARRIGLMAELQTGDPGFDRSYFLDTDRGDIILPYFSDDTKRRAVDALYTLGYPVGKVIFEKTGISIVYSPFPPDTIEGFPLERCLSELRKLSGEMSGAGYAASFNHRLFPGNPRPAVSRIGLTFLFIFNGFLMLAGIFGLAFGMGEYEPLSCNLILNALAISVPAALLYLFMVFRWIRGRSSSHRYYLAILILSLTGFPLAFTGGAVATNGLFDQGPETAHRVKISKLYDQQNKNSRTYYVAYPSWQQPGATEHVSIPENLYRVLRPAGEVIIKTKPGYWREEWIAGIDPTQESAGNTGASDISPLRLRSIRFYEGGASPATGQDKRFAAEFPRGTSRYIHCQVNMENDYWNIREQSYIFTWRYLNPDGSIRAEVSRPFTVRKDWHTAWVVNSWGWENPGNWPSGNYRVIVLVNGRPFGEGKFLIK